ncbi:HD-GYP domain-containing protein [Halodesulfovibrio marinisediminis]|uniref:Putative two-component system response regulator n=1 Tax=Halodesulfovibrio marinisediminis DSM 17456 TaxID=1121457 RepID=A0A1N6H8R2_9BACT|nr:HD domain-containing phosphohydrolase [Halodesulfovibrio marinisediminis]SIO16153.1 putative two-component system response regulator [Halodesulfovibrio marinisediminis DSM 17456]
MPNDKTCQLELKEAHAQLFKYAEDLHKTITMLKNSHLELEMAYVDTVNRLAQAVEYKDEATGDHVLRICFFSAVLAHALGLSNEKVLRIYNSAAMHDVGKISIPDSILLKPGPLTAEEFEIIKTHTTVGAKILSNSKSSLLETGQVIALNHHERWDGTGYPNGLKGSRTPIEGRIVGLVDVYDALRSERPYKKPYSLEKTTTIIQQSSGKHFDPRIVKAFFENLPRITYIDDMLRSPKQHDVERLFKEVLPDCPLTHSFSITSIL